MGKGKKRKRGTKGTQHCHVCRIVDVIIHRPVTAAVYRALRSRNADSLIPVYLTYVRALVEHDSVIWSPYRPTVKDTEAIETVQRRFTKRLPKFSALPYTERLNASTY